MKLNGMPESLDLGDGRSIRFFAWKESDDIVFAVETHPSFSDTNLHHKGEECAVAIYFDVPECPANIEQAGRFAVVSWEPLTLTPSVKCRLCGNHGFITDSRWITA